MESKPESTTTHELWARLFHAPSIDRFFNGTEDVDELPSFPDYISALCQARGEKPERIIKRSGLDRSFGHRLFAGTRNPSRDTVLQLAFGFELSAEDTQQLLKVARATALHPKVKRDAVIAFCLHNRKSLMDAQQILFDHELPLLGGARID